MYSLKDLIEDIGYWLDANENKWDWKDEQRKSIILHDQEAPETVKYCINEFNKTNEPR